MYISRSEIRKVVRELIKETFVKEGWIDFFKRKQKKKKIPLATDIKKWFEEYVDFRGRYKGPRIPGFTPPGIIICDPDEIYFYTKDVDIVNFWNEDVAKQEGYSEQQVLAAKQIILKSLAVELPAIAPKKPRDSWTKLRMDIDE